MTTAVLITARLKSTRLPRKVLRPLHGRPMLDHLVERMRRVARADRVVVITSTVAQDDDLVAHCRGLGVEVFRGHPDDVLRRMRDAARAFDAETVLSCTADNPFVSAELADRLLDFHWAGDFDFSRTEGLPWGTFSYALRKRALERACRLVGTDDTEVWGGYFTQTGQFRVGVMAVEDPEVRRPEYRLTVDTPADFRLAEAVCAELGSGGRPFSLRDICRLLDARPDLVAINAEVEQQPGRPIVVRAQAAGRGDADASSEDAER